MYHAAPRWGRRVGCVCTGPEWGQCAPPTPVLDRALHSGIVFPLTPFDAPPFRVFPCTWPFAGLGHGPRTLPPALLFFFCFFIPFSAFALLSRLWANDLFRHPANTAFFRIMYFCTWQSIQLIPAPTSYPHPLSPTPTTSLCTPCPFFSTTPPASLHFVSCMPHGLPSSMFRHVVAAVAPICTLYKVPVPLPAPGRPVRSRSARLTQCPC